MESVTVAIQRLPHAESLDLPAYATEGAAGMDLHAAIEADIELAPMQRQLIPTGIAIALPAGFEAQVRPRSGLALKHGMTLVNAPGTIDCDYRGEIGVIMMNASDAAFTITPGMRIAQMVIARYAHAAWDVVDMLPESTRGAGGFGSTGTAAKAVA